MFPFEIQIVFFVNYFVNNFSHNICTHQKWQPFQPQNSQSKTHCIELFFFTPAQHFLIDSTIIFARCSAHSSHLSYCSHPQKSQHFQKQFLHIHLQFPHFLTDSNHFNMFYSFPVVIYLNCHSIPWNITHYYAKTWHKFEFSFSRNCIKSSSADCFSLFMLFYFW